MRNEMDRVLAYNIANCIGPMIKNGIIINEEKIPFSMIDYYCITKEDIYNIVGKIRRNNAYENSHPYYSSIVNFIEKEALLVRIVDNAEEILEQKNAFIINGKRFEPTIDDIMEVFKQFDAYNIPKYNKLIFIALYRMAKGFPVLPLVNMEEEKEKKR